MDATVLLADACCEPAHLGSQQASACIVQPSGFSFLAQQGVCGACCLEELDFFFTVVLVLVKQVNWVRAVWKQSSGSAAYCACLYVRFCTVVLGKASKLSTSTCCLEAELRKRCALGGMLRECVESVRTADTFLASVFVLLY